MESASKKRGRPSKFTDEELARLRGRYPGVDKRQLQNLFYADKAEPLLRWYIKTNTAREPERSRVFIDKYEWILLRRSILVELGRILGKDWDNKKLKKSEEMKEAWLLFLRAVYWLGENKPNTKRAIVVLRNSRIGESSPADAQELAHKIAMMIIEYCTTHRPDDNLFITRTLDMVRGALTEILESRKSA